MKKILKGKFRKLRLTFNRVARIIEENRHIFDTYVLFTAFSKSLDPLVGVDKSRNMEHPGTFRKIPEHPGTSNNYDNYEKNAQN